MFVEQVLPQTLFSWRWHRAKVYGDNDAGWADPLRALERYVDQAL